MCGLLNYQFAFPARGSKPKRYRLLDIPEVLLIAALVVATKYNYPLDGLERLPRDEADPLCLQMDWAAWESEFRARPTKKPGILQYEHMDPQEVWSMDKREMIELLNWFQETQIDKHPTGMSRSTPVNTYLSYFILTLPHRRDRTPPPVPPRSYPPAPAHTRAHSRRTRGTSAEGSWCHEAHPAAGGG